MASQPEPPDDLRWLLQPPQPGQIHLHVAVGEGTQLSPELQEALEQLLRTLQETEADVSAYCRLITCTSLSTQPCWWRGTCNICRLG